MSTPARRRDAAGFTLVEVLVAVAVIAIALGAIVGGMARYADNAGYLRTKTVALWVAHNRMTEIALEEAFPKIGKSEGKAEMAGVEWRWTAEVKETTDEKLRRVDLVVKAPGTAKGRKDGDIAQLSGFVADVGRP